MAKSNISGGIVGAIIGAMLAGPLGAIVGYGLGSRFIHFDAQNDDTRRIDSDTEKRNPKRDYSEPSQPYLSDYAIILFFRCLGKLAKSDGLVSEDEAAFVRELMRVWEMAPEKQRRMGKEFNYGRDTPRSFLSLVRELADTLRAEVCSRKVRLTLVQIFCSLVVVDRVVHSEERRMLQEAGRVLGAADVVEAFFAESGADEHSQRQSSQHRADSPQDELQRAYDLLGIPPTATDAEVKSAYRRKAKEFHPDRAEGAGLSAAFIQRAKEQFQEIGNAYDTIRAHRGMK